MSSQKQIDANRKNAQKSTGPKTAEGKAKSRLNAKRDAITGQVTTLSDEDRLVFERLKADHVAALAPENLQETKLAHAIAWDTWRLDHLRAIEMNLYALAVEESAPAGESAEITDELDTALADARTFRAEAKRFDLMSLYEQRMSRNLHRNIALLRNLQAERKRNRESDKTEEVLIARMHEFNDMPIRAATTPSRNGFVFSDEEIAIDAVRQRYVDNARSLLKRTKPGNLFGALDVGCGDQYLRKVGDDKPRTPEDVTKMNNIPLATAVLNRLKNPDQYGIRS